MDIYDKIKEITDSAFVSLREHIDSINESSCESPIERLMRAAFQAQEVCPSHWIKTKFMDAGSIEFERLEGFQDNAFQPWHITIWPQVVVGEYRVDFIAQACVGDRPTRDRVYLAIECDGHEFHEKTKAQAARDKARDRYLVGKQIPVMRFTGSEIWRSAVDCAEQVRSFFEEKFMPQVRAAE